VEAEMQFNAIIEKDKNVYFAFVPELKGCMSQGNTFEEAAELYLSSMEEEEKQSISSKASFILPLNIDVSKSA
jgi:predicted RNase H-like HicB family nuclease